MSSFEILRVPPGQETDEIERLEALVADLRSYAAGRMPTDRQIRSSPSISGWRPTLDLDAFRLVGHVEGHPLIGPGLGRTSRVVAADVERGWMRTHSRLWRLAPAAASKRSGG